MTADPDTHFQQLWELQKERKEVAARLKEIDSEIAFNLEKINEGDLKSENYELRQKFTKGSSAVDVSWIRTNEPELYRRFAHVSHPVAVHIMSKICGGDSEFQMHLRDQMQEMFDEKATIAHGNLSKAIGTMKTAELEVAGAIYQAPDKPTGDFEVVVLTTSDKIIRAKKSARGEV